MRTERSKTPLAARLKQTAKDAGLTAEQLAERLGVSPAAVWAWWSGRNEPPLEMLLRYAEETGAPKYWLITGDTDEVAARDRFLRMLAEVVTAVRDGQSPAEAWQAQLPDELLDPEERAVLDEMPADQRFSDELLAIFRLTEDQRDLVLRLVKEMTERGQSG